MWLVQHDRYLYCKMFLVLMLLLQFCCCSSLDEPTNTPTMVPSSIPSIFPSQSPSSLPSTLPSTLPSLLPSSVPTSDPTSQPTGVPTDVPTLLPSFVPSSAPTQVPTNQPTLAPSIIPSVLPTSIPTRIPTNLPTLVPTAPSGIPSCVPTNLPTLVPSTAPSGIPSCVPTNLPTLVPTAPSGIPSCVPTSIPTTMPTNLPSSIPSSVPSGTPTIVPTWTPTSQPSSIPSAAPSNIPSSAPSSFPTTVPTANPTNLPTSHPTGVPTNVPSNIPSATPTVVPSNVPTCAPTNPSSTPTIVPSSQPSIVPSLTPSSVPTSLPTQLFCNPGQRKNNFAEQGSLECIDCPPGSISTEINSPECTLCPAGFIATTATTCEICPANTYQSAAGGIKCNECPVGTTSSAGAILGEDCISVIINYSTAFIALFLIMIISTVYIFRGRFMRVSYLRSKKLEFVEDLGEVVTSKIESLRARLAVEYALETKRIKKEIELKREGKKGVMHTIRAFVRFFLFFLILVVTTVIVVAINYSVAFIRIFFSSLLFAKSLNINIIFFGQRLKEIANRVVDLIDINIPGFNINLHIDIGINIIVDLLNLFTIDLAALDVTCKGAQAPAELMISAFILSFVWLSLSSNFQYYQSLFVLEYNRIFISTAAQYNMGVGYTRQILTLIIAGFISFASYAFSIQRILQLTMSAVNLSSFVQDNGVHAYTSSCNFVEGLENIDIFFAYSTTLVFYALIIPVVYSLSSVLVPFSEYRRPARFTAQEDEDDGRESTIWRQILGGLYGERQLEQNQDVQQHSQRRRQTSEDHDIEKAPAENSRNVEATDGKSGEYANVAGETENGISDDAHDDKNFWEEYIDDESGEVYYYNIETEISTFDRPECLRTVPIPWEEYYDDEGMRYYHNSETKETTYEKPVIDKDTDVNNEQGENREEAEEICSKSSSNVSSVESDADDRSRWEIHYDEEKLKYFYNTETLESTYDCPDVLRIVAPPWDDYTDDEGEKYYFNHDTNLSTYDVSEVPKFIRQRNKREIEQDISNIVIDIDKSDKGGDVGEEDKDSEDMTRQENKDQVTLEVIENSTTTSPLQDEKFHSMPSTHGVSSELLKHITSSPSSSKYERNADSRNFKVNLFMVSVRGSKIETDEKGKFAEYELRCELRVEEVENIKSRKSNGIDDFDLFALNRTKIYNWSTWKRYNDFKNLNSQLRTVYRESMKDIEFPSAHTTTFNKLSSHFIEKRKKELSEYWLGVREILPPMVKFSLKDDFNHPLNAFLDIGSVLSGDPLQSLSRQDLNIQNEFEVSNVADVLKLLFSYLQPDLLLRSVYVDWLLLINNVFGLEVEKKDIEETTARNDVKHSRVSWNEERNETLPTYHIVCRDCSQDMADYLTTSPTFYLLTWYICYAFCVLFGVFAQCCSSYGRVLWKSVLYRYYTFLSISIGYWSDNSMNSYRLKGTTKVESRKFDFSMNMAAYLAPRYVIMQLITPLTALSIYAINTSSCPIFVYSSRLKDTLPPLLYTSELAHEIAAERYMEDYGDDMQAKEKGREWNLHLSTLSIILEESRLMQFISLALQSLLAFLILSENVLINFYIIPLLILMMLPFHLGAVGRGLVVVGNALNLSDKDLKYVYAICSFLKCIINSRVFKYTIVVLFFPIVLPIWFCKYCWRGSKNTLDQNDGPSEVEQELELASNRLVESDNISSKVESCNERESVIFSADEIEYQKELDRRNQEIEEQLNQKRLNDLSKQAEEALEGFATSDGQEIGNLWEEKFDSKRQRSYWKNHETGEKTWTDPFTRKRGKEAIAAPSASQLVAAYGGGGKMAPKNQSNSFSLRDDTTVSSVLHDPVVVESRDMVMMDWEERFDKKKQKKYYKNKKTGMVQWKNPATEVPGGPKKQRGSKRIQLKDSQKEKVGIAFSGNAELTEKSMNNEKGINQTSTRKEQEEEEEWLEKFDRKKQKKYWKNVYTGKSQWQNPFEAKERDFSAKVESFTKDNPPTDVPTTHVTQTTEGAVSIFVDDDNGDWVQKFSETRQKYFYQNTKTGEKAWKKLGSA